MKRSAALAIISTSASPDADTDPVRPRVRADCKDGPRPCPWFGCKFHLALDITENGSVTVLGGSRLSANPSDAAIEAFVLEAFERLSVVSSCVLDVVQRNPDGVTLREIGGALDVSRERIRQIERKALRPLGPRIRRHLGRVTDTDTPTPSGSGLLERHGR